MRKRTMQPTIEVYTWAKVYMVTTGSKRTREQGSMNSSNIQIQGLKINFSDSITSVTFQ